MLSRILTEPDLTVDRFKDVAWINCYDKGVALPHDWLFEQGLRSGVVLYKFKDGSRTLPEVAFGNPPSVMHVQAHKALFELRLSNTQHPGLFLDHEYTRDWIAKHSTGKRVLNLFSYTASFSIVAAVHGAQESLSIDLSAVHTRWAQTNAQLNHLADTHVFWKGDVFETLKRHIKKGRQFDVIVCDPPSHARGPKFHFSTRQHLNTLHTLCLGCLAPKGTLISSFNTEGLDVDFLKESLRRVSDEQRRHILELEDLPRPKAFDEDARAMKGVRAQIA